MPVAHAALEDMDQGHMLPMYLWKYDLWFWSF